MATALNPFFKRNNLMAVFPDIDFGEIQGALIDRMEQIVAAPLNSQSSQTPPKVTMNRRMQKFFGSAISSETSLQAEHQPDAVILREFFDDQNSDLTIFDNPKYFKLRELFIDLNTKIPSSASVERLFSVAKKFWTFDRPNFSDKRLEHMIFLKSNSKLLNS